MTNTAAGEHSEARELIITRTFDAPRELAFKAWAGDPRHARNWWEPRDYPARHLEMDVQPGGVWRCCLQSIGSGKKLWQGGVFREVIKPEHIVFTFAWEEGGERGLETLVTVTFAKKDGETLMTFRQGPFQSAKERKGHQGGWTSTFDHLDENLAKP